MPTVSIRKEIKIRVVINEVVTKKTIKRSIKLITVVSFFEKINK